MQNQLKKYLAYSRAMKNPSVSDFQALTELTNQDILEAQRLHAEVYVARRFITPDVVGTDGRIARHHDPYQDHSRYFVVRSLAGDIVATARQVEARPHTGYNSFPMMKAVTLFPEAQAAIKSLDPRSCVEISALAKRRGISSTATLVLYRAMWQYSITASHSAWLIACDAAVYERLEFLFGPALGRVGEPTRYMGSLVVPAILDISSSLANMRRATGSRNPLKNRLRRRLINFFVTGLPAAALVDVKN